MKALVTYFSASGVTAKVAERLADTIGADLFQIEPAAAYTPADLNWRDANSRSSIEMKDETCRPEIAQKRSNMAEYDVVFVGFPIWWYKAPMIINTFLEQYDFTGKKIIPFATSGGSKMGFTNQGLQGSCPGAVLMSGDVLKCGITVSELREWAENYTKN